MKTALAVAIALLVGCVWACDALAASASTETESWASVANIEAAAKAMRVNQAQALEDLTVQHEAHETISALIEDGDQVWFDNAAAMIHVYVPATANARLTQSAIPAAVARHITQESSARSFPAQKVTPDAASCGTSRSYEEYCSPLQPGARIAHQSGAGGPYVNCTAGFMVRDYSGNPYILSAGHCNIWGTTFYENSYTSEEWPSLGECTIGPWTRGASPWSGYDASLTPVSGCKGVTPYIHNWETGVNTHQEGATNTPYVGEYVCHWGVTSLHQCGVEVAVNVPTAVSYEDTGSGVWTIKETDQVCGYAAPGDSGGPVTDGTYQGDATGILIAAGSDLKCGGDNTLWIEQRIFAALNMFGVYVAAS